ncbi:MAG TPA: hypothetical protein VKB87_20350 [Myxococcaceae bacterium]|nr:hypothetical protein [Myxococcaceae bacterium]
MRPGGVDQAFIVGSSAILTVSAIVPALPPPADDGTVGLAPELEN